MGVNRYQDLVCWQLACELRRRVRAITEYPKAARDFGFCDDILRSGRSAPSNIAEGFRRRQPRQFAYFMTIAVASIGETENHLGEALEAGYVTSEEHAGLMILAKRAGKASRGLLAYLEREAARFPEPSKPRRPPSGRPPSTAAK
jgi:four helix bundle protein